MNSSYIFYSSFMDALDAIDEPAARLEAYDSISRYAIYGEEPEAFTYPIAKVVFLMAKPQIDANSNRRSNGSNGGRPKKETTGYETEKPMVSETENHRLSEEETSGYETEKPNVKVKVKEKVNVKEKEKVNEKVKANANTKDGCTRKRFTPPTAEEVTAYCNERGNSVDAGRFVDFYASKGWKVGNSPMKDWKAAVRTWEREDNNRPRARSGTTVSDDPVGDMLLRMAGGGA